MANNEELIYAALASAQNAERQIPGAVSAWLEENVDPETGYVLDSSLTVAGAAADAKAAGDAVGELKSALGDVVESVGTYEGEAISGITVTTGKVISPDNGSIIDNTYGGISSHVSVVPYNTYHAWIRTFAGSAQYAFFDAGDNLLSYYCDPDVGSSQENKNYVFTAPAGSAYAIFGGGSSLNPTVRQVFVNDVDEHFKEFEYVDENITGTIVTDSYVDCRTGTIRSGSGYNRTGYIPVNMIETFKFSGNLYSYVGIYGFDAQKRPIVSILDRTSEGNSHLYADTVLTIPSGVEFIVASNRIITASAAPKLVLSTTLKKEVSLLKSASRSAEGFMTSELIRPSISLFHTFAVIGDSFSSGAIYGISGTTDGAHYDMSWGKILGRMNGMDCTNYATPGITTREWLGIEPNPTHNALLPQMLSDDPLNLYMIMLGINDTKDGDVDTDCFVDWTQNADTFAGNYGRVIGNIKAHAPKAKIICIKPPHGSPYSHQFDIIEEVAEFYGVSCIKSFEDAFFRSSYYNDNMSSSHPVGATYSGMAVAFARLVSKEMVENIDYFKDYEP